MKESSVWRSLKKLFDTNGVQYQRLECIGVKGVPDIIYSYDGHRGFIELKSVLPPKRKGTPVNFKISPLQRLFLEKHGEESGRCFVLARVGSRYVLLNYLQLRKIFVKDTLGSALWHCGKLDNSLMEFL